MILPLWYFIIDFTVCLSLLIRFEDNNLKPGNGNFVTTKGYSELTSKG